MHPPTLRYTPTPLTILDHFFVYNVHRLLKKIVVGNVRIKCQSYIFFSPLSMFHFLGEFKTPFICLGFYWRFHMIFLLSGCCVMDSKSVNISLNSGSNRKLTQLIIEDDRKYWYRIKKSKQLSLIIILLNIAKLVMSCRKYLCCIHQGVPTIRYFLYL